MQFWRLQTNELHFCSLIKNNKLFALLISGLLKSNC